MRVRSNLLVCLLLSVVPIIVNCQNDLCPSTINGISFPGMTSLRATADYVASDSCGNSYAFNFCGTLVEFPNCGGVINSDVCQNGASPSPKSCGTTVGQIVTAFQNQTVQSVSFFSAGGSPSGNCTNSRSTNITVTCVPNSPTMVIGLVTQSNVIPPGSTSSCLYLINMQSEAVCPKVQYPLDSQQSLILTKLQSIWGTQLGWDGDAATFACKSWAGVTCNQFVPTSTSFVVELQLPSTNLSGPIPDIIGELTTLQTLDLSENRFNGSIPKSLMQLPDIKRLALNNNALTGSIPEFLQSSPIVSLSLQFNRLSGGLPKSLILLGYLDQLFLQNNQLTGKVPSFVCILSSYSLQRNEWSCPVPVCCGDIGNRQCLPCSLQ